MGYAPLAVELPVPHPVVTVRRESGSNLQRKYRKRSVENSADGSDNHNVLQEMGLTSAGGPTVDWRMGLPALISRFWAFSSTHATTKSELRGVRKQQGSQSATTQGRIKEDARMQGFRRLPELARANLSSKETPW
jgi:hypothetical protein